MCGWALRSEGTPCVAQRVWAMPMSAARLTESAWAASSATLPTARNLESCGCAPPPFSTASPAES